MFAVEPRLRDAFLQVLFDHSNLGGFDGVFTSAANMRALRNALRTEAQRIIGPNVYDVLITDIVRQDTPELTLHAPATPGRSFRSGPRILPR